MKVTYFGHACMMMESAGTRILMDPWLTDPTYHGTWWHYPPLALGVRDLPKLDYLYVTSWSLKEDVRLILLTLPSLMRERRAH